MDLQSTTCAPQKSGALAAPIEGLEVTCANDGWCITKLTGCLIRFTPFK